MAQPEHGSPGRVAVACSGGRDSMALLLATVRAAHALNVEVGEQRLEVWALHVHHGLSQHADQWAELVQSSVERWAVRGWPVRGLVRRVLVDRSSPLGVEAAARHARYDALSTMAHELGADLVLLGHHRRDQAETLLLQALRGGSLAGLAAMPAAREHGGITWARPWLHEPRERVEAYGRVHGLSYVDDDSNDDVRHARNRLRLQVWPALQQAFPQVEQTLADTAARLADAQAVVQDWALTHLPPPGQCEWPLEAWRRWSAPLQRQSLLLWLNREGHKRLTTAQVHRLAGELPRLLDQGVATGWPDLGLTLYRGALALDRRRVMQADSRALEPFEWARPGMSGAGRWRFEGVEGVWEVSPATSQGVSTDTLLGLRPKPRAGGERWQAGPGRPARALKKQFQAAGVPPWAREAPLLCLGETLVLVPGLGVDSRWWAPESEPQWAVTWHPLAPESDNG